MKKSLLALAALGTIAGATSAQTNVTIYGIVDNGLVHESGAVANSTNAAAKIAPGASVNKVTGSIGYGSRLGFKGTEDLGGGLSAFFQIENGFQADTGTIGQGGLLFGRQAFVGLGSATLGSVSLGRQYSGFDGVVAGIDPFGSGMSGRGSNLLANGYNGRVSNSVVYNTPLLGGFKADVQYGFGEVAGNTADGRFFGGSVNYVNGPLVVRAAHSNQNNTAAFGGGLKNSILGAIYNFGMFKLHAAYTINKGTAPALVLNSGPTGRVDSNDAQIGVTVPFGSGNFLASYVRKNDKLLANQDASQIGVGYVYNLSKRTDIMASYGHIRNKNGAVYTANTAIENGIGNTSYSLGLLHRF